MKDMGLNQSKQGLVKLMVCGHYVMAVSLSFHAKLV